MGLTICTVITKNYVSHARVMLESLARYTPGLKSYVLFLDSHEDYLDPFDEEFTLLRLQDIGLSSAQVRSLYAQHSVSEVACIMKPRLVKALFNIFQEKSVFYADADLFFLSGLSESQKILEGQNLFLTPHRITPVMGAELEEMVEEALSLNSGVFNMGFFGARNHPETLKILDWWGQRAELRKTMLSSGENFFGQKWMDLVPYLFKGVHVSTRSGQNVGYWNLSERNLGFFKDRFLCGDGLLEFFHFKGFDLRQPYKLSRNSNTDVKDFPALEFLVGEYINALYEHGWEEVRKWPFSIWTDGRQESSLIVNQLDSARRVLSKKNKKLRVPKISDGFIEA